MRVLIAGAEGTSLDGKGREGEETVRKDKQTQGDWGLSWGPCLLCCGGSFEDGKQEVKLQY